VPRPNCRSLLAGFDEHLQELEDAQRRRRLAPRHGYDFASNEYLGLANSLELKMAIAEALSRGVSIGSGGSRLLRGNHPEHEMLEEEAARFFGSQAGFVLLERLRGQFGIAFDPPAAR
jgi:8-amino-7-oxononanoate synthase